MSLIKETQNYVKDILNKLGYEVNNVQIEKCGIPSLGQFQMNFCMELAKKMHKNPIEIANEIVSKFDSRFVNVNVAGAGFINVSFSDSKLLEYANECKDNFGVVVDDTEKKSIIIDYGGANVAKALHVGHMRSANIGEALKRLAKLFGHDVLGDVHWGDLGRQSGMLISEYRLLNPDSVYFKENYDGEYPEINFSLEELATMYRNANISAKENSDRMEEVRYITAEIDRGNESYTKLWEQMVKVSKPEIERVYKALNCTFELSEGELSSMQFVPATIEKMKNDLYESNGAMVIDVSNENDKSGMPPLIVIKSNGTTIYATRDLATLYNRNAQYNPDEIWYVIDNRQEQYFEQVFRAAKKTNIISEKTKLEFIGFGTINGEDGTPFKTRDGGVMELSTLIDLLRQEIVKRTNSKADSDKWAEVDINDVINKLTIATLKYADLSSYRKTDYIFNPEKFSSLEGKTGPYILYGLVRMKSLLAKAMKNDKIYNLKAVNNEDVRKILVKITELSQILLLAYREKSLNYITDFLYDLINLFNKFYNDNNIIKEENEEIYETYIALVQLVHSIAYKLLNVLAIDEVEKM